MRKLIVKAILDVNECAGNVDPLTGKKIQRDILEQSLKYIVSDASLICLARELGIDTDAVLSRQEVA